jgi:hypothetical protein
MVALLKGYDNHTGKSKQARERKDQEGHAD